MSEIRFAEDCRLIVAEVEATLVQVQEAEAGALEDALVAARTVFVTGEGRSGLVARACAMRLLHVGLQAYAAGDTITPAAAAGDLLVAISGSGETRVTLARAEAARASGVRIAAVTAIAGSSLWRGADLRVVVPVQESHQYGGSRFEQSTLILLDALALRLQRRLRQTAADMDARHATLE